MKKTILVCAAFCASTALFASQLSYYPSSFRSVFEQATQKNQDLKNSLFLVLSSFHQSGQDGIDQLVENCPESIMRTCYQQKSLGYDQARVHLFGQLHLRQDQQGTYLEDVYCNRKLRDGDNDGNVQVGNMIIPANQYINCEHTWPQSRFSSKFPKNLQKADLHHLYPTDPKANSERGNIPFGENNGRGLTNCADSSKGRLNGGSGSYYFNPPAEHRGNVARALFYFSVRYKLPIDATQERFLRQWHHADPVDANEEERNNQIEILQWNRNPFIDFPHLVGEIADF